MKQLTTEAIILKRIQYGEADRIVTVLTADYGRLSMLAKGVRKTNSKLAGGLELFSSTNINFIDGRSELKTITSTRLHTYYKNIIRDVDRTMAGYDYLKIIDACTQHIDEKKFYTLLVRAFDGLNDVSILLATVDVWFFAHVLHINGSGINVEKPLDADAFQEDGAYSFSYDDMSFYADINGRFGPKHIKFLRLISRASSAKRLTTIAGYEKLSEDIHNIVKQSALMHKA
jgi:DNA repair protein RecO (recombination protein O)